MNQPPSLNRYFAAVLCLSLLAAVAGALFSGLALLEERGAMLRESRFQFALNKVRGALESGLRLGLPLPDLPGAQESIQQNRQHEPVILSIDVFDVQGRIVFTTDSGGVGSNIPGDWRAACLDAGRNSRRGQDEEGRFLCGAVLNGYEQIVGGVVLRYLLPDRSGTFGLLGGEGLAALLFVLALGAAGILGGWWALRPIEAFLRRQADAVAGLQPPVDDALSGNLASALALLERMEGEMALVDAEVDRLDKLDQR